MGLDARAYLIRVERRLMQFHCGAPLGIPTEVAPPREAAE
ncbi:protein of unknown function (plasmid) [Azospirillum baldaniorum]|uniref:Uncharacterized protein n=1 Tax=Azospirillum baldaniorum TaxID=1064539 RepID=A0A9P1NNM6_9PROT|nr:protein of unknown function [Azospirillum baldaniorum]